MNKDKIKKPFQKELYGLNNYFNDLVQLVDLKKLPKVLMLSGKKGQGKFTLSHHLISYCFDKKNYNLNSHSIDEKNLIYNNIKENLNTNIYYFACSNNNVKIDNIRKLRADLQKSSLDKNYRFIIFDDVECLNENCVNSLLKTIEEPSVVNYFILINNKGSALLDTLKSRSIEILIFLNQKQKIKIIKKLIQENEIESSLDVENTTLTPGEFFIYNDIIINDKINTNDNLINNIEKLLKLNKLKKDIKYTNLIIHLINQHYFNKFKSATINDDLNDRRTTLIRMIHDSDKLNINNTNLTLELENYI